MQMNEEYLPTGLVDVLRCIAIQLKEMNKLKALELKGNAGFDFNVSVGEIEDILNVVENY